MSQVSLTAADLHESAQADRVRTSTLRALLEVGMEIMGFYSTAR